jgi:cytochrome c
MSLEANKVIGAVLLGGFIVMSANYISQALIHPEGGEGHGGEVATGAKHYPVPETAAVSSTSTTVVEVTLAPITPLLAAADAAAGAKVFSKCKSCHLVDGDAGHKQGPNLWDVVNRPIAAAPGFTFSASLSEKSAEAWDFENLNAFLNKPKKFAKKTKMSFAGLKKEKDRANVIAYLNTLSASPAPIE